eukprot:TRINITY_DN3058_c0_g1_i1.p3 TRINITY_DN3058_c0_g1~~TRINITY_DN3058_c0_g1_i1.p3  ORF type:complete len:58 (+),score=10.22 TRINITY_DN3058_c0_g1_i1:187-360(+)
MFLWRPSKHASRYAYAQEIATDDMDEDMDAFADGENALNKPDCPDDDGPEPQFWPLV